MENTKHCLNCGFDAPQQAHFCPRCGSNQFAAPPVRCTVCGAVVPQDHYCAHCGANLQNPGAQVWHNCVHCGAPVHVTYTNCNRCGAPAVQPAQPVRPKKKKKSGAWALVVVPILLLLIGIGILAVEYMEHRLPDMFYPSTSRPIYTGGWGPATEPTDGDDWPTEGTTQGKTPVDTTPATKPTQPAATKPATKPTEPKVTQPKPTEPKVTQPKPTEPKVTQPKPTQPKPTDPPPTEPTSNIPAEYMDNHYLISMGDGYCETMTGEILVIFLFVSDPTDGWTDAERAEMESGLLDELRKMYGEAEKYGASLNIRYLTKSVTITKEFSRDSQDWQEEAMIKAGLEAGYNDQRTLERDGKADQAPVVFLVDEPGRSYAYSYSSGKGFESVTILEKDYSALRHEMCHVFGAKDMYFPQETVQAAKKYLENGIMYGDCEGDIDDLTAFVIGWTDELSSNALGFLKETNSLTEDYIADAKEQDSLTGYGTKYYDDGDYYTGYMVNGVRHGEGTYYWADGAYFTGTWVNGVREGYGTLYYSDGYIYKGYWTKDERNGYGELTHPDGYLSYKGDWKNDKRHGEGTAIYNGTDIYTGGHVDGERHGWGIYTWANGTVYEGDWANGQRTGKGTMTWSDGAYYTGDWLEGDRVGKGTMTWSNGSYYTGDWADDTQHGYGEWYYADYGTRYVGDFVNGKRHGYGTYYYADGTTYYGRWENNARVD